MHLDVVDLRAFYARTALGRLAQRALSAELRLLWPRTRGQTVAGFGYATPVLRPYLDEARRVIALMPATQGVVAWPRPEVNAAVLCMEAALPVQTGMIDRLVVMHGLETSDRPGPLLDELWRVLAPGGRAVFVVPNRTGLWARSDATPFGHGRPFSLRQLEGMLRDHRFQPEGHRAVLFSPPSRRRFWLRLGPVWERAARLTGADLAGGVLMVEATKQVYARTRGGTPEAVRRPLGVLEGIAGPARPEPSGQGAGRG